LDIKITFYGNKDKQSIVKINCALDVKLFYRFKHRDDIFRRYIGKDIVDDVEHKPAAF
jgi:citrate lyase synthetase